MDANRSESAYALADMIMEGNGKVGQAIQDAINLYAEAGSKDYEFAFKKLAIIFGQDEALAKEHQSLMTMNVEPVFDTLVVTGLAI